jgi:hypothetical protein
LSPFIPIKKYANVLEDTFALIKPIVNLIMKKNVFRLKNLILLPVLTLLLYSCEKDIDNSPIIEKEFNLDNFTKINAGERFNLIVTNEPDFHILAKGPTNSVNEMEVYVSNGELHIDYVTHRNNRPKVDVYITLPVLSSVNLSGAASGTVEGFEGSPIVMRTLLSGASTLKLTGTGVNTNIDLSGASKLEVTGTTASLYGNLSGAANLKAYGLEAQEVDIMVTGGSVAYVNVVESLIILASGGSKVYYRGDPTTKHFDLSGGSQVIED